MRRERGLFLWIIFMNTTSNYLNTMKSFENNNIVHTFYEYIIEKT